jgi:hypothetical protein
MARPQHLCEDPRGGFPIAVHEDDTLAFMDMMPRTDEHPLVTQAREPVRCSAEALT